MCRRAFTLVELIMVMTIIGVISAIAVPRYASAVARYRIDTATRRVMADLAQAQSRARATSRAYVVTFDEKLNTYTIADTTGNNPQVDLIKIRDYPYSAQVATISFGSDGKGKSLQFDHYGTPSSGGFIRLTVGANTKTILVDSTTGKTTLQ